MSVSGLTSELGKELNRFSPGLAAKLVDSMKRRVAALMYVDGDYTMY
jgi:hypothetical protein